MSAQQNRFYYATLILSITTGNIENIETDNLLVCFVESRGILLARDTGTITHLVIYSAKSTDCINVAR